MRSVFPLLFGIIAVSLVIGVLGDEEQGKSYSYPVLSEYLLLIYFKQHVLLMSPTQVVVHHVKRNVLHLVIHVVFVIFVVPMDATAMKDMLDIQKRISVFHKTSVHRNSNKNMYLTL